MPAAYSRGDRAPSNAPTVSATGWELLVHGLATASRSGETFRVPFGETGEATFTAERPGIYPYWAGMHQA